VKRLTAPLQGPFIRLGSVKGRSKGVCIAAAAQDRKGLQHIYGENIADEQLSQAATIGILRLQNTDTAKWASELIGQYEALQLSHSSGPEGAGNETATPSVKDVVLPSEIMRLPEAGPENGLPGFFLCPAVGVWHGAIPWDEVMAARAPAGESDAENYVKRTSNPGEELSLSDRELSELGISGRDLDGENEGVAPSAGPRPTPEEEERALLEIAPIAYEEVMN
jgi:hypothetical protein